MKAVLRVIAGLGVLVWLAGCASQEEAPEAAPEEETTASEQPAETTEPAAEEPAGPLDEPDVAYFEAADGSTFASGETVSLPTGGPPAGRLLAMSANPQVTLYVTRDRSVPSAQNNWGGPIDPEAPRPITRLLEGVALYQVVAEMDGAYSDPFTLAVQWRHEESPELAAPAFLVDGREVSGSVEIPVSDGSDPAARLEIVCGYSAAMLYINRDGTEPTVDDAWESQRCEGTYLWSPEPTTAEYRVIASWQGVESPVAELSVEWVE
ncbi:MAG: hypothetical protein ACOC6J_05625 [Spirochaetota bacterium]